MKPGATLTLSSRESVRFWLKIDLNGPIFPTIGSPCWIWKGARSLKGYGQIAFRGKVAYAHRISFEIRNGPLGSLHCCHRCDNPSCVNPDHLWAGTNVENVRDCIAKGRNLFGDKNTSRTHPENLARGEAHGQARLTERDVRAIREGYSDGGVTQQQLASKYGVSRGTIAPILRFRTWKHTNETHHRPIRPL